MWWDRKDACHWPICVKNACIAGGEGSCHAALHASMPNKMEALSDTCLQIPCSFDAVPPSLLHKNQPIIGVWLKSTYDFGPHPESVVFNGSKTHNIYPISIIGNMSEYNCTTVFTNMISSYANVYYFRVESTSFRATDFCNHLTITVKGRGPHLVWGSIFLLLSLF